MLKYLFHFKRNFVGMNEINLFHKSGFLSATESTKFNLIGPKKLNIFFEDRDLENNM